MMFADSVEAVLEAPGGSDKIAVKVFEESVGAVVEISDGSDDSTVIETLGGFGEFVLKTFPGCEVASELLDGF